MITLTGLHGQPINLNERVITRVDSTTAEGVGAVVKMKDGGYVEVRERPNEVSMIINDLNGERLRAANAPIDMILHCPKCGRQHIDSIEHDRWVGRDNCEEVGEMTWNNPPHRSHLCHGCGFIWRPADIPTNGVASIQTKGTNDHDIPLAHAAGLAVDAGRWRKLPMFIQEFQIDYVELVSKIDAELK